MGNTLLEEYNLDSKFLTQARKMREQELISQSEFTALNKKHIQYIWNKYDFTELGKAQRELDEPYNIDSIFQDYN